MKVGEEPDADIERVRAVREAVGPDVLLRIDANGGYTYPQALRVMRGLADVKLEMFEQPLPKEDIDGAVRLRSQSFMAIGADEGVNSVRDATMLAQRGAADVFTLKLVKIGGIYPALQAAAVAKAHGIDCVVASTYDTQVNAAHCLHLACALPEGIIPCDLTCYATQAEQAESCHILKDGMLRAGDLPGCGVLSLKEIGLLDEVRL